MSPRKHSPQYRPSDNELESLAPDWKVMRVNRTYDERFLGSVYHYEDRLVAVLLQPAGEYLSREFEVHQWQEATLFLDSVYKGVSLAYKEEE